MVLRMFFLNSYSGNNFKKHLLYTMENILIYNTLMGKSNVAMHTFGANIWYLNNINIPQLIHSRILDPEILH